MIESEAISTEETSNNVYPPARQMTRPDYDRLGLLIDMDSWNIRNTRNICDDDPEGKIVMLMDFTQRPGDMANPWYTGDFKATLHDVLEGY